MITSSTLNLPITWSTRFVASDFISDAIDVMVKWVPGFLIVVQQFHNAVELLFTSRYFVSNRIIFWLANNIEILEDVVVILPSQYRECKLFPGLTVPYEVAAVTVLFPQMCFCFFSIDSTMKTRESSSFFNFVVISFRTPMTRYRKSYI